jgi:hypothetical protein
MRAVLVMLGAVAMLVGVAAQPASAGKGTDIEQFIKRIGKYADDALNVQKPRGLCVCQDGSSLHTRVGALVYDGQLGDGYVTVRCVVFGFAPTGLNFSATVCDTFEVLSK